MLLNILESDSPSAIFKDMKVDGTLRQIYPEIDTLFGIPQTAIHHPEIDTGIHTLMVLDKIASFTTSIKARFGGLVHDLGKGVTPTELLPKHHGHELAGVNIVIAMGKRLNLNQDLINFGCLISEYHTHIHKGLELKPSSILKVLNVFNAYNDPDNFRLALLVCKADAQGRLGFENRDYPQLDFFTEILDNMLLVNWDELYPVLNTEAQIQTKLRHQHNIIKMVSNKGHI